MPGGMRAPHSGSNTLNRRKKDRAHRVPYEEDDVQPSPWTRTWRFATRLLRPQNQAGTAVKDQVERVPWVPRHAARDALMSAPPPNPDDVVAMERRRTLDAIGFAPVDSNSDSRVQAATVDHKVKSLRRLGTLQLTSVLPAAAAPSETLKQDSVMREDAIAESLQLLTASASERGMDKQTSATIPRWRARRPTSVFAYNGTEMFESHGPMTGTQASERRMLQGLGLTTQAGYRKVGAYGLPQRSESTTDSSSPNTAMMSRYDAYAARRPPPTMSWKGKQAVGFNLAGGSSPSISPTTGMALSQSLPFAPRSNDSLDSSATGTMSIRQAATPKGTHSTAATSLDVEERDRTTAKDGDCEEMMGKKEEEKEEEGEGEDDEKEAVFYDVENILAWL